MAVEVENLIVFLRAHVSSDEYNFVSLRGGKYHITREYKQAFLDLYCKAAPFFTEQNATSLIWRAPKQDYLPLIFDIDLQVAEDVAFSNETFIELAQMIMFYVSSEIKDLGMGVVLTRKQRCYPKETPKGTVFKTGFHMFVFGILVSKELALKIRNRIIEGNLPCFLEKHHVINPAHDVLDKSVCPFGKNGLVMLSDYKREMNTGKAYSIFFRGTYNYSTADWNHPKEFQPEQTVTLLGEMRNIFWGWLWNTPKWPKFGDIGEIKAAKSWGSLKSTKASQCSMCQFNLTRFLEALPGWIPDNEMYRQIVYFCSAQGLDPAFVGHTCNAAWGYQDQETEHMMRNATDSHQIGKGSLIRILKLHSKEWNEQDIFGEEPTVVSYYNEYVELMNGVHTLNEVERFLLDTCQYVIGCKKFTWLRYTNVRDKHNHIIKNIVRPLTKEPPFSNSDDFVVRISPGIQELINALEESCKKIPKDKSKIKQFARVQELLTTINKLPVSEAYIVAKSCLGDRMPEPEMTRVSKILKEVHLHGRMKRYLHLEFTPYSGTLDPTDVDILNTFSSFPMETYVPSLKVDIRTTTIWKYLYDVFGHQQQDMKLLNFLLDFIAWKIQHPNRRSGRIICVVSKRQGTGKSSLFHLLQLVMGSQLCSFHDCLDTLTCRFNFPNHSKLCHWVDDVHAVTNKNDTRKLFPKATCKFQKYEAKGQGVITLQEFSEIWVTANDQAPLHVSTEDRRIMIIEASDCHKQETEFFDALYAEFENLDIGHALYTFLKHRDVSTFKPSNNPPSLAKARSIERCMVKSHVFLTEFFKEHWLLTYKPRDKTNSEWTSLYQVFTKDMTQRRRVLIRIEHRRFYKLYSNFTKEYSPSSRVREYATFYREMEQLDIIKHKKRRKINGKNKTGVDIDFQKLKTKLIELYPATDLGEWISEIETTEFVETLSTLQKIETWK